MINQIHNLGDLFEEVQMENILGDGKTFPDCVPKRSLEEINLDYQRNRQSQGFDLRKFVAENFQLPNAYTEGYKSDKSRSAQQHVEALWEVLTRKPDAEGGSLLPLPHPYIVPGGRFREIYYWDSYFTMLGLRVSKRWDLIQHMVDNFSYLIDKVGYIPNGNRTYFLGRSQPPFYSLMVKVLGGKKEGAPSILLKYLPSLEKEYAFWMQGATEVSVTTPAIRRVVRLKDGSILNRYWDENDTPRPEAHKEDVELSHQSKQKPADLYRHLRAAAESGWDFSTRWFKDVKAFGTIHTTDIVPVDLNCLLWHLEQTLSEAYHLSGKAEQAANYSRLAEKRKVAVLKYCWNPDTHFFFDYDFIAQKQKEHFTLAAAFPLFFGLATAEQGKAVGGVLQTKFLKPGGLTTTVEFSGQQWDAPNGWAPLQWIAYKGMQRYGMEDIAGRVRANWMNANLKVYANTGKMTEKYDVWSDRAEASGGEYPNQDGFGWTNGVFLAMSDESRSAY